mmetsp:Transcript_106630/g.270796  ORF Transcript_106630/g.270796 Transcript_106630/m.270796 type:complete len:214 (-) Transcript_106630:128-769(-)
MPSNQLRAHLIDVIVPRELPGALHNRKFNRNWLRRLRHLGRSLLFEKPPNVLVGVVVAPEGCTCKIIANAWKARCVGLICEVCGRCRGEVAHQFRRKELRRELCESGFRDGFRFPQGFAQLPRGQATLEQRPGFPRQRKSQRGQPRLLHAAEVCIREPLHGVVQNPGRDQSFVEAEGINDLEGVARDRWRVSIPGIDHLTNQRCAFAVCKGRQ